MADHEVDEVDEEEFDRRLEAIEERVNDAYPDGWVSYSAFATDEQGLPIDNLDEVAVEGNVVLVAKSDPFFGAGKDFTSEPIVSPTWMQVVGIANQSVACTKDEHHVFLEELSDTGKTSDGARVYALRFGS
jgi:hypothetical protein